MSPDSQRPQQQGQHGDRGRRDHHGGSRHGGHGGGGGRQPQNEPSHLSSPYNFVPLADDVFIPDWPEPSHDCPFSDAVSGELHLKLTAESPIHIRGTHPKPENKNELLWHEKNPGDSTPYGQWTEFYRNLTTGKYAIPGTSLKGALRNVLKIVAFGSIGYADDDFIFVRDLNDLKYTNQITKPGPNGSFEAKVRGGWLSENPDRRPDAPEWIIAPCKVARVEQCKQYPDDSSDPDGLEEHGNLGHMALGKGMLSARAKYRLWDNQYASRSIAFDLETTKFDDGFDIHRHSCGKLFYARAINLCAPTAKKAGTLVFTGQSGAREKEDNNGVFGWQEGSKHMEFIFYDDESDPLLVSPPVQKKFEDTHPDDNEGWKYWRRTLDQPNGRVPVFWIENENTTKREERVIAFGLAQMFRFPARNLHDAIPPKHKQQTGLDMADRLFGTVRKDDALHGRISFSALICDQKPEEVRFSRVIPTVLGTPRSTFYPAYLEQAPYSLPEGKLTGGKKGSRTWLSPEVRIRGWKRYPVADAPDGNPEWIRHEHSIPERKDKQGRLVKNYDVATAFRPIQAGATFSGSVRFHNLTRKELGALVWTLTWGRDMKLRHSLGMGKSLGMGSCVIEIDWEKSNLLWRGEPASVWAKQVEQASQDLEMRLAFVKNCQDDFNTEMDVFTSRNLCNASQRAPWLATEPMKELLAMADPANSAKFIGHKAFPALPDFRHLKSGDFVVPRTTEILCHNIINNRQTTSGNPALPDPQMQSSDEEMVVPVPVVQPPPPALMIGQHVKGILVPEPVEPGKPAGTRIYFSPDGHPELAGNAGIRIGDAGGPTIGERWTATIYHLKPPIFKLLGKL